MIIKQIAHEILAKGGRAFYVGGYVRDKVLGLPPKDIDVEVFYLYKGQLLKILERFSKVSSVGASFGVMKLTVDGQDYDFSLPRKDNKVGRGHKGFVVETCKDISPQDAALRRDFTMNSMFMDIPTDTIVDPYNGQEHIAQKRLVHTSDHFGEDPLRVLRAMQFAGRFDMAIDDETAEICESLKLEFSTLPKERIWMEFEKLFQKSMKPSRGIEILQKTGWIEFFPEIASMDKLEQDPEWHPEGDVLAHTKHVMDEAARLVNDDNRLVCVLAALCHDMGKITTTEFIDGRLRSRGHDQAGVDFATKFMESINTPHAIRDKVLELVREHMVHVHYPGTKRTVRRLLARMEHASIDELMVLIEADHSGRPPLPKKLPEEAEKIREIAKEVENEIKPILLGRHLIDEGMKPGKHFGPILRQALEAQLDGEFNDVKGALEWLRKKG